MSDTTWMKIGHAKPASSSQQQLVLNQPNTSHLGEHKSKMKKKVNLCPIPGETFSCVEAVYAAPYQGLQMSPTARPYAPPPPQNPHLQGGRNNPPELSVRGKWTTRSPGSRASQSCLRGSQRTGTHRTTDQVGTDVAPPLPGLRARLGVPGSCKERWRPMQKPRLQKKTARTMPCFNPSFWRRKGRGCNEWVVSFLVTRPGAHHCPACFTIPARVQTLWQKLL